MQSDTLVARAIIGVGLAALLVASALSASVFLAARSSHPMPMPAMTAPEDARPAPSTGSGDVVEVRLTDFAIEPARVTVPAGTPATLLVVNEGAIDHDLVVQGVTATALLRPGQSAELQLPALEPGSYQLLCDVPGHVEAGMAAELVVSEDGTAASHPAGEMTAEEMDASYMAGVEAFPAATEGSGGQPLEPRMDGDVKVFEVTTSVLEWEVEPGVVREAWGYNGQVPGPEIRVALGDRVRVVLHNELPESTSIHFHGLVLPNEMDGVPGLTQELVKPGGSHVYEFEVRNSGSHMYHSHMNGAHQIPMGLLGAFIVEGPEEPDVDQDVTMILNDGPLGYTINGKGFPATQPVVARLGETVRIRYMNEGLQIHPMHLHGMPQTVIARDGMLLESPHREDTVLVAPGQRVDVLVEATEPGLWAFHCHILTHAENAEGMFGMVTVFVVEP